MYDLNTMRSIHRENEGGKLPAEDRKPHLGRHSTPQKTLVVPIDLSSTAANSLEYAVSYASNLDSNVLVVYVVPRFYGEGLVERHERRSLDKRTTEAAEGKLKKLIASKKRDGVPIKFQVRHGFPEYEIIKAAEEVNAEMIVIARSNRGLLRRMLFGSVTENILDASPVPVLVITGDR